MDTTTTMASPLPWLNNYHLLVFNTIDSTNDEGLRLAKMLVDDNYVIWSRKQEKGRGRYGRLWTSEIGNFFASVLLCESINPSKQPEMCFVAAVALYDAVNFFIDQQKNFKHDRTNRPKIALKWPNDLILNDKKVAGILIESINFTERQYIIVGVGINIKSHPLSAKFPATNLKEEKIIAHNSNLLHIFVSYFDRYLMMYRDKGFPIIRHKWMQRAYNIDKTVGIMHGGKLTPVYFREIDCSGAMIVEFPCGKRQRIINAEVQYNQNK